MSVGLIPPTNPATTGGMALIGIFSASAGASIDCLTRNQGSFSGALFQNDFDSYLIDIPNIVPGTAGVGGYFRVSTNGTTFDSANNYANCSNANNTSVAGQEGNEVTAPTSSWKIRTTTEIGNNANHGLHGRLIIRNPLSATQYKNAEGHFGYYSNVPSVINVTTDHIYISTTPVVGVQFFPSSGTCTGIIYVYGLAKSASTGNNNVLSGTVVQKVNTQVVAFSTGTTVIPIDDTIPQNTEGDQYMTLAITPKSATNKLEITAVVNIGCSIANWVIAALFQDATANAIDSKVGYISTAGGMIELVIKYFMTAGTTSATTFKVRCGPGAAATLGFNGNNAGRFMGGVINSSITIEEIAV